jgi:hypothetical protein
MVRENSMDTIILVPIVTLLLILVLTFFKRQPTVIGRSHYPEASHNSQGCLSKATVVLSAMLVLAPSGVYFVTTKMLLHFSMGQVIAFWFVSAGFVLLIFMAGKQREREAQNPLQGILPPIEKPVRPEEFTSSPDSGRNDRGGV